MSKSRDAFRTISEVADWLDTPAHVLRFWESKFTQVKPVKRAGGRRYYRPADMELLGGIKQLLHEDGMTIKGVQKVLREKGVKHVAALCVRPADEDDSIDSAAPIAPVQGADIPEAGFIDVPEPDSVVPFPPQWDDAVPNDAATDAEGPGAPADPDTEVPAEAADTADADAPALEHSEPDAPSLADEAFAALDPQADRAPDFEWARPSVEPSSQVAQDSEIDHGSVLMDDGATAERDSSLPTADETDAAADLAPESPAESDEAATQTDAELAAQSAQIDENTPAKLADAPAAEPIGWPLAEDVSPAGVAAAWPVDPDDPLPPQAAPTPETPGDHWPAAQTDAPPVSGRDWPEDPKTDAEPPTPAPQAEPIYASEPDGPPVEHPDFGTEMPEFLRSVFDDPPMEPTPAVPTGPPETAPEDRPAFLQPAPVRAAQVQVPEDPDLQSLALTRGPLSQLVQMTSLTGEQARLLPGVMAQLEQVCVRRGL